MPSLAIVIVNYNTRELLAECLRSVFASRTGGLLVHTIVVDNGSSDGSAAMVRAEFPRATLIESDRNGGFGYANNLALRWLSRQSTFAQSGTNGGSISESGPAHLGQPLREIPIEGDSPHILPCDYILFLN